MGEIYNARFHNITKEKQSISCHNNSVALFAETYNSLDDLKNIVYLTGIFHDSGKYSERFQEYLKHAEEAPETVHRGEVDHSTAGGLLINKLIPDTILCDMIQYAIYSHHGILDCIFMETGDILFEKRKKKKTSEDIQLELVENRFYEFHKNKERYIEKCEEAKQQLAAIIKRIKGFIETGGKEKIYGNINFFLGMYERIILSLLMDGDKTDSACFSEHKSIPSSKSEQELKKLWKECIENLEQYIEKFKGKGEINNYRKLISDSCRDAAEDINTLYCLNVPTGAGKTLASLRFALYHAEKYKKQHIIYIAPYHSILEQNAEEIRKAIEKPNIVLEHHCNIIYEKKEEQEQYDKLIENWDSPVIITTAVQFLNTLFSSQKASIRRMHNICNSVLIFDEVQALPIRTIELFNLAINFLTIFGRDTVLLCSATQPLFDKIPQNRMLSPKNMVHIEEKGESVFHRTTLIDKTDLKKCGLTIQDLGEFAYQLFQTEKKILIIVNTKACAENLYIDLKNKDSQIKNIFHLSTNMCAAHRQERLEEVKSILKEKEEPCICISTQLIEAGVDISFSCVIRSLAGLDSLIQTAGRCNRHKEQENGNVYIVRMSKQAENIDSLADIKKAQEAMQIVLNQIKNKPDSLKYKLDSKEAITQYYQEYFYSRKEEMNYKVQTADIQTNLIDLLSSNPEGKRQAKRLTGKEVKYSLKQAFKTAGEYFDVIPEDGKFDVIVEYNEEAKRILQELQQPNIRTDIKKQKLKILQRYTVGISQKMKEALRTVIYPICDGTAFGLSENYYSKEIGVTEACQNINSFV